MIRLNTQSSNLILVANDEGIEGCSGTLFGTGRLFLFERHTSERKKRTQLDFGKMYNGHTTCVSHLLFAYE